MCLLILSSSSLPARASHPQTPSSPGGSIPSQQPDGPVVARLPFSEGADLQALAARLDIWEVHHDQGYLVALLSPQEYAQFLQSGRPIQIDQKKTSLVRQASSQTYPDQAQGIPGYDCYRTVEETYADLSALAAAHPQIAQWQDIGDSWEKATSGGKDGYDLRVLVLTNTANPAPKPAFFLMAAIHAREYVTAETATRFAEYLVDQYGQDADVTWLLDHFQVHILAVANPDGRKIAESGSLWRKNTDSDDGCSDASAWGTDLNRNSAFHWGEGGSSSTPCDEVYRGPEAASEPEVQAIQNDVKSIFPDQRGPADGDAAPDTTSGVFITLHSYGDLVLWPWGWTYNPAPNDQQLAALGQKLAYFNHFLPEQSVQLYPTSGSTDDWAYGELGVAAYTFEMGNAFFQDCSSFESTIYPQNLQALLFAAKSARQPYLNPGGPDSTALTIAPDSIQAGQPVTLTAIADGTRFPAWINRLVQPVQAAHYSLDIPPWEAGAQPLPMQAADGAFDQAVEQVQAVIDTQDLSSGKHLVFVESQDILGVWGVTSAAFLTVSNALPAAAIEGYTRSAATNAPLVALVKAGVYQTSSDANSGYYRLQVPGGVYDLQATVQGYSPGAASGVQAAAQQTLQQNLYLAPLCTPASDHPGGNLRGQEEPSPVSSEEACYTPLPPRAQFAVSDTAVLGTPVAFHDRTRGTVPLTYWWDFGDGSGGSAWSDPQHTYSVTGTFTVTLKVSNSLGAGQISHTLVVEASMPVTLRTIYLPFLFGR